MRVARFALLLLSPLFCSLCLAGPQKPVATDAEAVSLAQKALGVLTGGVPIADVTLTGTARRIAGSDDETGTATLKAMATGEARMDFSFPSGLRSEVRANSENGAVGNWLAADGAAHPVSSHNLMNDSSWFFPAFTIGKVLSPNCVVAYVGQENRDGQSVLHLAAWQWPRAKAVSARFAAEFRHLTQTEIFLDPATLLPVALSFNVHPDNDAGLDIPVEVRFSDYRQVSGAQVPFHIQKYLNNTLVLDLQFRSAALNTGVSASAFQVQ